MNKNELIQKMSWSFNKATFSLKKHSPEILIAAGVVGTVASAVMACRATTKVSQILDNAKDDIDAVHSTAENEEMKEEYSESDAKKDLTIIYAQTGVKLVKLYAPSVILGALSITSIVASNNILRKRNAALGAAYAVVDKSFKEYRGRVVERFGEQVDKELKYDIKAKKIEQTVVDEKTGKEKKVKTTVDVVGIDGISDFARFFDESSPYWEKNPEYNLMFLRAQQNYANDKLRTQTYLYLNDVYRMLGLPDTKEGQYIGWRYDPNNPDGDNFIDFGIYNVNREKNRDFVNGYENVILLDFNVDGNILKYM